MQFFRFSRFSSCYNKFAKLVTCIILSMLLVIPGLPQVIGVFDHREHVELLIGGVETFFYFILISSRYLSLLIIQKKLKLMCKSIRNWKNVSRNRVEMDIFATLFEIESQSFQLKLIFNLYIAYVIGTVQIFVSLSLGLNMVNVVLIFIYDKEYLVDEER
ncbi:uncharacterized protein LOC131670395 [Phymastichus coffea]|uniref:uncharacterized protein LOC131670395 n=1 Tax=Phymastichus coffea TaxID=108790 RepID=UPI00273C1286|nr:uncharacterized protein LOC131670395 [Phymastichus coffea]